MPLYTFEGRSPTVDSGAFIAPTATLVGDVHVEAGASVWFNAVLRADFAPIIVREGANVQDCCVLHAPPGLPVDVGPGATVAHGCVILGVHLGAQAGIASRSPASPHTSAGTPRHRQVAAGRTSGFHIPAGDITADQLPAAILPCGVDQLQSADGCPLII